MLPVLLDLKFIKIYTFGVFLVLAFFWGAFLLWNNIRLSSYKEEEIFDGLFLSLIGGLFLGRLVYVILHFADFGLNMAKFILINGYPGLSMVGCITGALITLYLFAASRKLSFMEIFDYASSPLMLAIGIAKMGSFFSGAEVGTKTQFMLSVKYVGYDGLRHLTGLYEGFLYFIGAFIAYRLLFAIRRQKYPKGFTLTFFWWYLAIVSYSLRRLKVMDETILPGDVGTYIPLIILLTSTLYFLYYFRSRIFRKVRIVKNIRLPYGRKNNKATDEPTEDQAGGGESQMSQTD